MQPANKVYDYFSLNFTDIPLYSHMTYPSYRPRLRALCEGDRSPILAIGVRYAEHPAGMAMAQVTPGDSTVELLSVFVEPEHRRLGIATALICRMEEALRARGCQALKMVYEQGRPKIKNFEKLMRKCLFPPPHPRALICRCESNTLKEAPWLYKSILPAAFEMILWKDVTDDEKQAIKEMRSFPYPDIISPFRDEAHIEPLNSLGLRYKGEIIGWQINHRIARDTIRYTAMFVREDLQGYGLVIPLMIESIKRHIEKDDPDLNKATFIVPIDFQGMINFVNRRMAPYIESMYYSVEAIKNLERT